MSTSIDSLGNPVVVSGQNTPAGPVANPIFELNVPVRIRGMVVHCERGGDLGAPLHFRPADDAGKWVVAQIGGQNYQEFPIVGLGAAQLADRQPLVVKGKFVKRNDAWQVELRYEGLARDKGTPARQRRGFAII